MSTFSKLILLLSELTIAPSEKLRDQGEPVKSNWQQDSAPHPSASLIKPTVTSDKDISSWPPRSGLPVGTVRNDYKEYEEVIVPVPQQEPLRPDETLVEVEEAFEEWAQPAFIGIKRLNRIQSRVYEAAYHSNENLLICAPTGSLSLISLV